MHNPTQPAEAAQDGIAHVLGGAIWRVGKQCRRLRRSVMVTTTALPLAARMVSSSQSPMRLRVNDGGSRRPMTTMQQLAAAVTQTALAAFATASAQLFE